MRVLAVAPWFPCTAAPGSGLFNLRDAQTLAQDNDVVVLHLCRPEFFSDAEKEDVAPGGIRVVRVPFSYQKPWLWPRAISALRRLSRRADLVHTMAMPALAPTWMARLLGPKPPWVHTEHYTGVTDRSVGGSAGGAVGRVLAPLFAKPTEVVAVSDFLADSIREHRRGPMSVIPNAVMTPEHDPSFRGQDEALVRLIAVGNLIDVKGPLEAVRTLAELRSRGIDARLTWVGVGVLAEDTEALAGKLGVSNYLTMTGHVEPEELSAMLLDADAFLMPTRLETFGVAFAEALTHGLPVVASGRGGHLAFLPEGASRVVEPRDPVLLADAVQDLLSDPARMTREQIAAYGVSLFSEATRRAKYREVYARAMGEGKPTLLIVSFSDIRHDARVKKQISLFAERYDVTVCGWGEPLDDDVEQMLFEPRGSKRSDVAQAAMWHAGMYRAAYCMEPDVRYARRLLRGRRFDAVIANDIEPIGMAVDMFGAGRVHAELHEYYPGLQDQDPAWVKLRQPYYRWMLRHQVSRAASATTVSEAIAQRYRDEFAINAGVVYNALPLLDFTPTPVGDPIRIVHSGGAQPNRRIEVMMEAVAGSSANVTLDLFLTGQGSAYSDGLYELAQRLGDRITVHPPVPYQELIGTLNAYDIGIHILPATATNNVLALPNKIFDYVQARLAVVVGPTPEMSARVKDFDLGLVTDGFERDEVIRALDLLTAEDVSRWKHNSEAAAVELQVGRQLPVWSEAVATILKRADG